MKMQSFFRGVSGLLLSSLLCKTLHLKLLMFYIFYIDDSDLNLNINKENFTSAVPLHDQGFAYMWAGARSTYGFKNGKVYYDVKVTNYSNLISLK